jgi:carbon-monoxide dehydrogenase medium subunit
MKPAAFDYQRAESMAQAVALLQAGDGAAKACSGSQSLGPMLNLRLAQPAQLVDVSRLQVLRGFELLPEVLRIGAAVTHARIEDGELPDVTRGMLPAVASNIAYRAVRNRGTLGGSLAHADPAADWVATLRLLDASIRIQGPQGERALPASEFLLGPFTTALDPDELVVAVDVPRFSAGARWAYRKMCRKPGEFAEAIGAIWIDPARGVARALVGALGGMPYVVDGAEAVAALEQPAAMDQTLGDAGLEDPDERALYAAILRRALADIAMSGSRPA